MSNMIDRTNHSLTTLYLSLHARLSEERGQTTAEYVGLIVLVVAILAAAAGASETVSTAITEKITEAIEAIQVGG